MKRQSDERRQSQQQQHHQQPTKDKDELSWDVYCRRQLYRELLQFVGIKLITRHKDFQTYTGLGANTDGSDTEIKVKQN